MASDVQRDDRALDRFDLFLFTAVATVLVVRAALAVTGYPQVGGGGLHIAHVLWGGLLMAIAIILVEVLPGSRIRVRAAFIGGIGFGLFIDEVGKFVTKDVDYFFKPAIAIMYATFVTLYIIVREALSLRPLTDRRRLAIASGALADLALGQLDRVSRDHALALLDGVDDTSEHAEAAAAVRAALQVGRPARPGPEAWVTRGRDWLEDFLERLLSTKAIRFLVLGLCVVQAVDIVGEVVVSIAHRGKSTTAHAVLDTGLPSLASGVLVVVGVVLLILKRQRFAIEVLRVAVMIELLFTQVIVFERTQWLGLIGFGIALVVLWTLRLAQLALPGDSSGDARHPGTDG